MNMFSAMTGDQGISSIEQCLALVDEAGYLGTTAKEIEDLTGIKAHKRLPELEKQGKVARALCADGALCKRSVGIGPRDHQVWVLPEHAVSRLNGPY